MKITTISILFSLCFFAVVFIFTACALNHGSDIKVSLLESDIKSLSSSVFEKQLSDAKKDGDYVLLDVRTFDEFNQECLEGSKNIDFYDEDFDSKLLAFNKESKIFVYCRSGRRSAEAILKMKNMGYTDIYDLAGGINAWNSSGKKIIKKCV